MHRAQRELSSGEELSESVINQSSLSFRDGRRAMRENSTSISGTIYGN
jgi:hypothetical protein